MDYLQTLEERFRINNETIAGLEKSIAELRAQQAKIQTARALHAELGLGGTSDLPGLSDLPAQRMHDYFTDAGQKLPPLRVMLLEELKLDSPLTKETAHKRLEERYGVKLNLQTVGSTLSKMAARGEIEKAGHFAYRSKSEVPNGVQPAGTSGATTSADGN